MSVKKDIRFRVYLSFSAMLLFALMILIKIIFIQQKEGPTLRALAEEVNQKTDTLLAERGSIYTEDGMILSSTIPQFDYHVDFSVIPKDTFNVHKDALAAALANLFKDKPKQVYLQALEEGYKKGTRYWKLKQNADFRSYQAIRTFPIFKKGKNKGGLIVESKTKRQTPYGSLASRTIGLWRKNSQMVGLEAQYDSILSGSNGFRVLKKVAGDVWMPVEGSEEEPVDGNDIVSTIDIGIQDVAENALREVVEKYEAQYGTAIVMEVKTGKIRALANLGRGSDGQYYEDFNYALQMSEPGSTFKLFSLLSIVDDGYENIDNMVSVGNGQAFFGKIRIRDDHAGLGTLSIRNAFAHSSNVAFAKLVNNHYQNNPMKYIKHLQDLGLDKKTAIDIPGESTPIIKTVKSKTWNKVSSLPMIAYGYESAITPMHLCMAYNAVANNGTLMKPYLVSAIKKNGQVIKEIEPKVLNKKIAKQSTINQLKDAMHAVVEGGTARRIKSPYFNFGGKTGTAQVAGKGFSYSAGIRQGSFVGFFPLENPQYTICVVVRSKPHGVYYGAVVGTPVFQKVADKLYATKVGGWQMPQQARDTASRLNQQALGGTVASIAKTLDWKGLVQNDSKEIVSFNQSASGKFIEEDKKRDYTVIPNVKGLGLKDALDVLELSGVQVSVSGAGKVLQQSLEPGVKINKGQKIHLTLG